MLALITGASAGIGEALAHEHASKGGDLILVARREDRLRAIKSDFETRYGVNVHVMAKDLSTSAAAQQLYDEVRTKELVVEYLINNAGFGLQGAFHEQPWERVDAMIHVNILALTALTRLFLPEMVQRNRGRILNVASAAAKVPAGPLQSVYFATKHYVLAFSKGLAGELLDTNITVTALCPGPIATEFSSKAGLDKTGMFDDAYAPGPVARQGYQAMLDGKLVQVSGLSFTNRLMLNILPWMPQRFLLRQIRNRQAIKD